MDKLLDLLEDLHNGDMYPFHMPGHKRFSKTAQFDEIYGLDITEIDGFDNLHHPEGILKREEEFAAELFGAQESFYIVNGSTAGVLASISSVVWRDEKILCARNVHKSAYHALFLREAEAHFLYPEQTSMGGFASAVSVEEVREQLEKNQDYKAVFLTSPSYEGIVSRVSEICELAHSKGIPVIVDEAHGAHLGIWGDDTFFPGGALSQGADIVIESLHKTLPAMTQTAIIHVQGNLIDRSRLKQYLSIYQTSSPSYILMASISECLHYCAEHKKELLYKYKELLTSFYQRSKRLKKLRVLDEEDLSRERDFYKKDPGKLVIYTGKSSINGNQLYTILREKYQLQMEMAARDYVIAMTSIFDSCHGMERLMEALEEIDQTICSREENSVKAAEADALKWNQGNELFPKTESVLSIAQAASAASETILFENSAGKISQEYLYLYPPGIPYLVPGEIITKEIIRVIQEAQEQGLHVQGPEDYSVKKIKYIKNMHIRQK